MTSSCRCLLLFCILLPTAAIAGPLDDYYLARFSLAPVVAGAVTTTTGATTQLPERCGTPLRHDLQHDWSRLQPETQKALQKVLARPALAGEKTFTSPGGHFTIHYAASGTDAPPATDLNADGIPDWVRTVADTFETVYSAEVGTMLYRAAPTNGNAPYDVYLQDQPPGQFGESVSDLPVIGSTTAYTSYIAIDNDYSAGEYGSFFAVYTPEKALQITAAHEYLHAIQFGYNFFFDTWYAEATSTWVEDEVYDDVNQSYAYLAQSMANPGLSLDTPVSVATGGGYGRWLFNRHLAESFGRDIIRQVWEQLSGMPSASGADIPMVPVLDTELQIHGSSVGTELGNYVRKIYQQNWATHPSDIPLIHPILPAQTFSAYPMSVGGISLNHLAWTTYRFIPSASAPTNLNLLTNKTQPMAASALAKSSGGATSVHFPANGNLIVIAGFGTANTSETLLLLVNGSTSLNAQTASFTTNGASALPAPELTAFIPLSGAPGTTVTLTGTGFSTIPTSNSVLFGSTPATVLGANPTQLTVVVPQMAPAAVHISVETVNGMATQTAFFTVNAAPLPASGGGSSSHCFIATAAYGSPLHPNVASLRAFRDRYLLTNAPGRAFVRLYYRISPPLAAIIATSPPLKAIVRILLTPLVLAVAYPTTATVALVTTLSSGWVVMRQRRRRFTPSGHIS